MIRYSSFLLLLLTSCASRSHLAERAMKSYRTDMHSVVIDDTTFPIEDYKKNKEAVWQLLDRATIRLAQDQPQESLTDFLLAIDAIDYYRNSVFHEQAAQLLIEDKEAAYSAPIYEAILARVMAACACFQTGDPANASALLRQAYELESLEQELGNLPKHTNYPLLTYLLALAMEREGDASQARLLHEKIGVQEPLRQSASLICIVHEGLLPLKESAIAPKSIICLELLDLLLSPWNIRPAISTLSGIAIPVFPEKFTTHSPPPLFIDGKKRESLLAQDVFENAKDDLHKRLPTLATRAAARQMIRRAGVAYAYEKGSGMGTVVDIGVLIANLATTADIRMWHTLPKEISLFRLELEPGAHSLRCAGGKSQNITLQKGDLCIVQLFRPLGKETHFLIPKPWNTYE